MATTRTARRTTSSRKPRTPTSAACALALLAVLGCGAQRVKMYHGPERPASETATVSGYFDRDSMMVTIESVDSIPVPGQGAFRGGPYSRDTIAIIEPGRRELGIKFWGLVGTITVQSQRRIYLEFDAEAGRNYEVRVARDPGGVAHPETLRRVMIPGMGSLPWVVWVIDLETGQRLRLYEEEVS